MASPAARARKLIEELGATFQEYGDPRTELLGNIDAPVGKVWNATMTHTLALGFKTNRPAGWLAAIQDMEGGLVDCKDADCEVCEEDRASFCTQCGPGHAGKDGLCERHGKKIAKRKIN